MARDRANINTNIWTDTHWRTLTRDQQWLYKLLLSHPELSYAGVADWRPGRLAQFSAGTSRHEIERIGAELQAERFVFIDEETEEVMIRSFLRHDGLLKQPRLTVSMVNAYGAVASNNIREVIIHELKRLYSESPELNAFKNDKVQALLRLPARPMEAFTQGFTPELTLSFTPAVTPNVGQAQGLHTSTATSTATPTDVGGSGGTRRKPERPLPDGWHPNEAHKRHAAAERINLDFQAERFKNWALAKDARYRDWDRAFNNWLLKAEKQTETRSPWETEGIH